MTSNLPGLGFSHFFEQQVSADELQQDKLARIIEVQRSHLIVSNGDSSYRLLIAGSWFQHKTEERPTIGDWVVIDEHREKIQRLLTRKNVFQRVAVGKKIDLQLIAANLDFLFIVTSCNEDFNEARIERYLSMAQEAQVKPVVIITKGDLVDDPGNYQRRVHAMQQNIPVEVINALSADSLSSLAKWTTSGVTVGLVGSSGVGKSTIVNLVCENSVAQTADIRQQDGKGRHTTSFRSLHQSPSGGLLLDLPGMREIKLADLDSAVNEVFSDIETLAENCKFSDCAHGDEPDCAVVAALDGGKLDPRRLASYRKLSEEQATQSQHLAKQRHRSGKPSTTVHERTKSNLSRKDRGEY